jgi:CheY-like chemotaxis protein
MDTERIHILVVDDVVDTAESTADMLTLWGYDAIACDGGAMALTCALVHRPATVLLDLLMPEMDGFQFARALHELPGCEAIPLIAVSGYWTRASASRAVQAGIAHYLVKPAELDQLEALLALVTQRKAASSGLRVGMGFPPGELRSRQTAHPLSGN